jgi:hypothetical protein
MAIYYRAIVPSGFGIKFRELTSKEGALLQRAVAAIKGDDVSRILHMLAKSIVAITAPLTLVPLKTLKLGDDGKPLRDAEGNLTGEMVETGDVDVDATLNATKEKDWLAVKFDPLDADSPGQIFDVFKRMPDFSEAVHQVETACGMGVKSKSLLSGKAQLVSDGT